MHPRGDPVFGGAEPNGSCRPRHGVNVAFDVGPSGTPCVADSKGWAADAVVQWKTDSGWHESRAAFDTYAVGSVDIVARPPNAAVVASVENPSEIRSDIVFAYSHVGSSRTGGGSAGERTARPSRTTGDV